MKSTAINEINASVITIKRGLIWSVGALLLGMLYSMSTQALTLNVVDNDGVVITDYRWTLEEDLTKESIPGKLANGSNLSLSFHTSYMPVVASGASGDGKLGTLTLDPAKRYYISVMPGRTLVNTAGQPAYQLGGAQIAAGQDTVTVRLIKGEVPTAQFSVFVFHDNQPINGAPDIPGEVGLGGFSLLLYEAGGTFGASGGQVTQNAFGHPIGTEYKFTIVDGKKVPVFDADGAPVVETMGKGYITTSNTSRIVTVGENQVELGDVGVGRFKYLVPAKYTIKVVPPGGADSAAKDTKWHQTSTIEGTQGVDAWVKADEPGFFAEGAFGPPGHHVFIGFVGNIQEPILDAAGVPGTQTVTGRIVNNHGARPPDYTFFGGEPVEKCRIGLNRVPGDRKAVYTTPCNADGTFTIPNVPAGIYQLVVWDDPLDRVILLTTVRVPAGAGNVALGDVPIFAWFARMTNRVFYDANANGFWDRDNPAEYAMPGQAMNLRFRDGAVYQSSATGEDGEVQFKEIFPFFNWITAEVDFARYKATGATIVVDNGGKVPPHDGWATPSWNVLSPQPQTKNNAGAPYRTETGPVLVQGFQGFLGTTNVIEWGKQTYATGENGGVSGIVRYAITRAEDDPRYAAPENWEPGVPRVQVNLYRDCNNDNIIDEPNAPATPDVQSVGCASLGSATNPPQLADVDNYPFGWSEPAVGAASVMGAEDVERTGNDGVFSVGWTVGITHTDSWDDNLPTDCEGATFVSNNTVTDCYDGLRNYNQVRPAVFDGGYAFGGGAGDPELPFGGYIVEANTPPGYEPLREEHKNVDFGDTHTPSALLLPPVCVGDPHLVPDELSLFAGVPSAYAGQTRPLCDRKSVRVAQGLNTAADFFVLTETPVAAHVVGMILDDTANEFDPNAPTFGERHAPLWMPVSMRDWTGREVSRIYGDQWGNYNALVPSTLTMNPAMPSGAGPNMLAACLNDPGPIIDQRAGSPTFGQSIIDPYFNRQYGQFCWTLQYLPGRTTYLDTPVVPVAAFAGPGQFPLDCEFDDGTPVIYSVQGTAALGASYGGPYVPLPSADPATQPLLKIVSVAQADVPNPAYDGTDATPKTIKRDFGFGATTGTVILSGVSLPVVIWTNDIVVVRVPDNTSTGQLEVTRGDNLKTTVSGVTVTVGTLNSPAPIIVSPQGSIQAAVDEAQSGDLILVSPGTYNEYVIVDKKVRVQGWGAPSTIINVPNAQPAKLAVWNNLVESKYLNGNFDLVPGQGRVPNAQGNTPPMFGTEQGPGFLVVAKASGANAFDNIDNARIDGFTITGSTSGGGIFVNGYANYLEISNNKIIANSGSFGGGIRLGHPELNNGDPNGVRGGYTDNNNDYVRIHHNHITQNGNIRWLGTATGGAGVSMSAGSDNYRITGNHVCGNYSLAGGGGIGHIGHSANGLIDGNTILFNQSFNQGQDVHGGGILVAGQAPRGVGLSAGTGSVSIVNNLIQGNQAGAGDGGGINLAFVNGLDVAAAPNDPAAWYQITLQNNRVVNNVAGLAGAVTLLDVVRASISNNTIANNDSTATSGSAFAPNSPNMSTPQSAGIVSRAHSATLIATGANIGMYANPLLDNNILWHNRSFYWEINPLNPSQFGLIPNIAAGEAPVYSDLAVLGTVNQGVGPQYILTAAGGVADKLAPSNSVLSNTDGYDASNTMVLDPMFAAEYFNGSLGETILNLGFSAGCPDGQPPVNGVCSDGLPVLMQEGLSNLGAAPAFDEGGNFIDVRFGPLTRVGDYRLPNNNQAQVNLVDALPPVVAPGTPVPFVPATPAPERTAVFVQCPGDVDGDAVPDGAVDPNKKCMHLTGGDGFISMADGRRLYMFGFADLTGTLPSDVISAGTLAANFPAPTISLKQGHEFFLTLTNVGMVMRPDLNDPHTVHFHGFPNQAPVFDGMPEASFGVNMGTSLTYYYNVTEPGTYMYHCHMEATEHMQMGMLGNLYVTPAQDGTPKEYRGKTYTKFVYNDGDGSTGYDKGYPLQMGSMDHNFHDASEAIQPLPFAYMKDTYAMINGRGYPDTVIDAPLPGPLMDDGSEGVKSQPVSSLITLDRATEGNTLLLRLSDLSVTNFYTITALGLPMRVVGGGAAIARGPSQDGGVTPGKDLYYYTNSVTVGGGEAVEVIIDAADVPAGTYFLYTTNLNYLSNNDEDYGGMMTEIVIQ